MEGSCEDERGTSSFTVASFTVAAGVLCVWPLVGVLEVHIRILRSERRDNQLIVRLLESQEKYPKIGIRRFKRLFVSQRVTPPF